MLDFIIELAEPFTQPLGTGRIVVAGGIYGRDGDELAQKLRHLARHRVHALQHGFFAARRYAHVVQCIERRSHRCVRHDALQLVATKMKRLLWLMCLPMLAQDAGSFKFAVSGDSRNCGDVVMPAIAFGVRRDGAEFYWHLGDFRAIYMFDEDIVPPASLGLPARPMTISLYESMAWPDFIARQMTPFGNLPVYLGIGNHETIPPATREGLADSIRRLARHSLDSSAALERLPRGSQVARLLSLDAP